VVHGFLFDGDIYARIAAAGTGIPVSTPSAADNYEISMTQRLGHLLTKPFVDGLVANSRYGGEFAQKLYGTPRTRCTWCGTACASRTSSARPRAATDYRREFFGPASIASPPWWARSSPPRTIRSPSSVAAELVRRAPEWRVSLPRRFPRAAGRLQGRRAFRHQRLQADGDGEIPQRGPGRAREVRRRAKDLPAIVKQSDVLFVTSAWEGFPNSVLEAMVLGVPW
jgi:hypothetical protein